MTPENLKNLNLILSVIEQLEAKQMKVKLNEEEAARLFRLIEKAEYIQTL